MPEFTDKPFCVRGGEVIGNVPTIEELVSYIKEYILNDGYSSEWSTDTVKGATRQAIYNIIQTIVGQLEYKGLWDASGGVYPSNPELGWYYVASVAGEVEGIQYEIGDWIIWNGIAWDKLTGTIKDYILNNEYSSEWGTDTVKGATRQAIYNILQTIIGQLLSGLIGQQDFGVFAGGGATQQGERVFIDAVNEVALGSFKVSAIMDITETSVLYIGYTNKTATTLTMLVSVSATADNEIESWNIQENEQMIVPIVGDGKSGTVSVSIGTDLLAIADKVRLGVEVFQNGRDITVDTFSFEFTKKVS